MLAYCIRAPDLLRHDLVESDVALAGIVFVDRDSVVVSRARFRRLSGRPLPSYPAAE
jgi:hypothetical protein